MTASVSDSEEEQEETYGYLYSIDDPEDSESGQTNRSREHRPLTFDHPRTRQRGDPYRKLVEDYSPSEDEYPPRDEIWPEQAETTNSFEPVEETDWDQYVRYFCRHCAEECINRIDEERTLTKECKSCFDDESKTTLTRVTHHLPEKLKSASETRSALSELELELAEDD
ncbi:hypothetical protein [Halapricum desulfuricans]|uniref:Uncharacterized protein n=1 Tax=Halapricum desulfuricans TaxID=2841257 RepID=A0A897N6C7_9EURY|nr:hypothetical protein [Halapricum desulfuricans]QSG05926.1 hypothetical protein HSR121_1588 [Halapricum desulfuricans]